MKNYIIDMEKSKNVAFENPNDPVKISSMRFCYINIFKDTKEGIIVYTAYTENNERIILGQNISLSDDNEIETINIRSNNYICITDNNKIIKTNDYIDTCKYIQFPNITGILITDFLLREDKPDIVYALLNNNDNKASIFKLKLDKHILFGVYCIYRALNNLSISSSIYKFANDWMVGDTFIKDTLKNASIYTVTSFSLVSKTKTTRDHFMCHRGKFIYGFNTISVLEETPKENNFTISIDYERTRPLKSKFLLSNDVYNQCYSDIIYEINFVGMSINLDKFYLFCKNMKKDNMIILIMNDKLFSELRTHLFELNK